MVRPRRRHRRRTARRSRGRRHERAGRGAVTRRPRPAALPWPPDALGRDVAGARPRLTGARLALLRRLCPADRAARRQTVVVRGVPAGRTGTAVARDRLAAARPGTGRDQRDVRRRGSRAVLTAHGETGPGQRCEARRPRLLEGAARIRHPAERRGARAPRRGRRRSGRRGRLPQVVGGWVLRHAWDSIRPGLRARRAACQGRRCDAPDPLRLKRVAGAERAGSQVVRPYWPGRTRRNPPRRCRNPRRARHGADPHAGNPIPGSSCPGTGS